MAGKKRIAVLISGRGSNMMSLIDACEKGDINGEIAVVISNKKKAPGLEKAKEKGYEAIFVSHKRFTNREDFDGAVVEELWKRKIDLICLAGFMRLLSPSFIRAFPNRIMNIHPSLLPAFPGLEAQWQAIEHGVKVSGATVHFVDEKLDHGPIIIQQAVPVEEDDSGESLANRILKVEHQIYPEAVRLFCADRLSIEGRSVLVK